MLEHLGRIRAKSDVFWTESIFKEALDWRETSNGLGSFETVTPLVQLANINFWKRDYKKSADLYTRALTILADSPTANGDDITFVYYRSQCSYRKARIEDKFGMLKTAHAAAAEVHQHITAPTQIHKRRSGKWQSTLPAPAAVAE